MSELNDFAVLKGVGVHLHFGQKTVLEDVNFSFSNREIVGVVGKNGSGKSSFLKLITGEIEPDSGNLEFKNGTCVDYVAQEFELDNSLTVLETIAKKWFGLKLKYNSHDLVYVADIADQPEPWKLLNFANHELIFIEILGVIKSLDCPLPEQKISNLSGGERRKVALASALFTKSDILILDEPTNHLDIRSIEKLELLLKTYPGTVIIVSHDRYFLDKLAGRMIEIYDKKVYDHKGNYHDYLFSKAVRLEIAGIQEDRKQSFLKREIEWVRAGVKARGTKDKGRLQRFNELKNQHQFSENDEIKLLLPEIFPLGNKIVDFEEVDLEVAGKQILSNFSFSFQAGLTLGVVGANGCGKTTFVKSILGQLKPAKGKIKIGQNTIFNYQDQEKWTLDLESTPFEEIAQGKEITEFGTGTINTRSYLRRFLFDNNQIMTPIKYFSGGERARILLAKLFKNSGNFLILDEPTNDLDLDTIRLLEESLLEFDGVSVVVSHDRYFLNRVCNYVLAIEGSGKYTLTTGNYDDYLAKKQTDIQSFEILKTIKNPYQISAKEQRQKDKDLKTLERQIEKLETKIKELEANFEDLDFYTKNPEKYHKTATELENSKISLDKMMTDWETLSSV